MSAKRLLAEAREAGHAEKTIRRAAKAIGVEQIKEGGHYGSGPQKWVWTLKMAKKPEDAQAKTLATFSNLGHLQDAERLNSSPTGDDAERF
jgi:hypothetical protein